MAPNTDIIGAATQLNWSITSPCCYSLSVFTSFLLVRAFLAVFKAFAMKDGEHVPRGEADPFPGASFARYYWIAFSGFIGNANTRDYWLPALIGLCELAAFPVLLKIDKISIIGGWLILKASARWGVWEKSRTAYNRFLVANIIVLAISYFWLGKFVHPGP